MSYSSQDRLTYKNAKEERTLSEYYSKENYFEIKKMAALVKEMAEQVANLCTRLTINTACDQNKEMTTSHAIAEDLCKEIPF